MTAKPDIQLAVQFRFEHQTLKNPALVRHQHFATAFKMTAPATLPAPFDAVLQIDLIAVKPAQSGELPSQEHAQNRSRDLLHERLRVLQQLCAPLVALEIDTRHKFPEQ